MTDYVTLTCRAKNHPGCPGWFREDVLQPWSNAICACPCHQSRVQPKVQCDICAGRGFDYLGRPCRRCASFDGPDMPNEDELEEALLRAARGELNDGSDAD